MIMMIAINQSVGGEDTQVEERNSSYANYVSAGVAKSLCE